MNMLKNGIQQLDNGFEKHYLRDAVGLAALEVIDKRNDVCFVSANVMSSCRVLDSLDKYPDRSFCVGISEQEMISFSAGLASEGLIPFAFTMAPFMTMRACEQVRTDLAYNHLNVNLIAPYAGVSGGISGATHWAIEDCSILRGIPEITILEPCDATQARRMVDASVDIAGPVYIRVGIDSVPEIYADSYIFEVGHADTICEGFDGTFICSGVLVKFAIMASKMIREKTGKNIAVVDMHTIKPIDKDAIAKAAKTEKIVVAQDHNIVGGLGEAVASELALSGKKVKLRIVGIPDKFVVMAHAPFLYKKYGMDENGLYKTMMELIEE